MVEFEVPEIDYTRYSNRQLMAVPLAVLAVALAVLAGAWVLTGSPVALGIDFTGGSQMTVQSTMSTAELQSTFSPEPVSVQTVQSQADRYVLTFDQSNINELREQAQTAGISVRGSGSTPASFGADSMRIGLVGIGVAFLGMSILAFALFRTFVPSIAIVISAFSDLMIPLAVLSLLGVKLSLGTIAGLLMLIGYSVDSDILLNNHILRRRGEFYESTYQAMQTGVTMTLTSLVAMLVMAIMATYFNIQIMAQIGFVLVIGLAADLMNTYMLNLSLLRWYKFRGVNK
ncbi:protein translocase subunit SecF [Halorhabdus sp. CBA1104]|uniref:protein translocase subunit SecF n=1 Tax=unclassified Halorhabdus TaxID=2621901 RepID=UPI0012B312C9|nr:MULTISPECIES: protein translocase subunit SecF [unclassified Halorhabdus]QGN07382.1 protein translocase subunit SecF [Halorhabdus sp. CBA1104]